MIKLPDGWTEKRAWNLAKIIKGVFAWHDQNTLEITYYFPVYPILYFCQLHERWHAATGISQDCADPTCVMYGSQTGDDGWSEKGIGVWKTILQGQQDRGDWYCLSCRLKLDQAQQGKECAN